MITYPVSSDTRFVVYRISTGEIIKRNATWPNGDGSPLAPGALDPDYAYLEIKHGARPDYDPRFYVLVTTETPNVADEAWNVTYTTQKRPAESIVRAAENVESEIRERILPQDKVNLYLLLAVWTLFRRVEGLQLTAKETALKDKITTWAQKAWQNRDAFDLKKAAIEAGQEPDLDDYPNPETPL